MKIAVDTNVLLRIFVDDDPEQSRIAVKALEDADAIAVGLQVLCETVWVLNFRYKTARDVISATIRQLLDVEKIIVNRPAVEAGLVMLEEGGDFADGVIAFEGRISGGDTFVTFDRKAARILTSRGHATRLLAV